MTTATPAIQVGSLAIATRASGVCDVGERGVCYEVYALGGRPGYGFLFEQGRYDGFSPEDVALCLTITGEVCTAVAEYQFTNVTRLTRDFTQGRFAAAFPPRPPAPLRNDAAVDACLTAHRAMARASARSRMTIASPSLSPEASVKACGGHCPVCRSGQIAGDSFDAEAAQVWQRVRCLDCEAVWTAVYSLQGYEDLECPTQVSAEEQARLLREVLRNRDLNPHDVLNLATGVEAALLALPAIQAHIQAAWHEEHQRATEEAEEREAPSTAKEVRMAERMCPVCKKRPVWRTKQSNNWRHLCKRCYHKAWAADQKAQRAARRATREAGDASSSDMS